MKLNVEQRDAPFDVGTLAVEFLAEAGGVLKFEAFARFRRHADSVADQLGIHVFPGPVGVVADKVTAERGVQQRVKTLDVVAVAGNLDQHRNPPFRRDDQMLAHAVEAIAQRFAVAVLGQAAEPFFLSGPGLSADVDRMGIDDEKGGSASPFFAHSAPQSFSMSGVRMARRSAKFGRDNRRGNALVMTGLAVSQL